MVWETNNKHKKHKNGGSLTSWQSGDVGRCFFLETEGGRVIPWKRRETQG